MSVCTGLPAITSSMKSVGMTTYISTPMRPSAQIVVAPALLKPCSDTSDHRQQMKSRNQQPEQQDYINNKKAATTPMLIQPQKKHPS